MYKYTDMRKPLFIAFLALICACRGKQNSTPQTGLSADFQQFYEKFHADSVYQMAHIQFPVEGADSYSSDPNPRPWTPENWIIHKPLIDSLVRSELHLKMENPPLVVEMIYHKNAAFAAERRFLKSGNEWSLIYYMALNPIKQ
ncbi:MAG: hypothetical protein RL329_3310 [Bacteroidota bacterium]|jgi:hypothetical protein